MAKAEQRASHHSPVCSRRGAETPRPPWPGDLGPSATADRAARQGSCGRASFSHGLSKQLASATRSPSSLRDRHPRVQSWGRDICLLQLPYGQRGA